MNSFGNPYNPYNPYVYSYGFNPHGFIAPEEYMEKLAIKRFSNSIGAAFLILQAISFVLSIVIFILGGFNDVFMTWVVQIFLSILILTVPFIISAKMMRVRVSDIISFKKVQASRFFPLVLTGLGICILGNIATSILGATLGVFGFRPSAPEIETPEGILGGLIYFIGLSVVPALVEEFALRGVVLGSLRRFGDGFAIFMSALLFGIMHGNLVQAPFAFIVGLGLGFVTVASGSMWPAIVIHFLNNFFSLIISEIIDGMSAGNATIVSSLFMMVLLALGLVGASLYLKKYPAGFRLNKPQIHTPTKRVVKYFLAAPLTVITLIVYILTMILNQVAMSLIS